MAAGEAENPRVVMPKAFNAVFYRLTTFFVLGSLAVGILVPYDDAELTKAYTDSAPGAAASPYVVAMNRLRIAVLPHLVNAMVLTAAFSAGNSYVYCASRSLYGLALEGKAPAVLTRCTRAGVPYLCVAVVLALALLSFLQVSNSASVVLQWFVNLVTASQLINFSVMCFTYLRFHKALAAQGISRADLPYRAVLMPYAAYYGLAGCSVMTFVGGYTVFLPGHWNVPTFLFSYVAIAGMGDRSMAGWPSLPLLFALLLPPLPPSPFLFFPGYPQTRPSSTTDADPSRGRYTMIGVCPVLFVAWKLIKRTKFYAPHEVDLFKNLDEIDEYQRNFVPTPDK